MVWKVIKSVFLVGTLMGLLAAGLVAFNTNVLKVNRISLFSSKLPEGFALRVLQISDLHNKEFGRDNGALLHKVRELKPDLVVLTGDLIDIKTQDFRLAYSLAEKITAINPNVYYVSGNHEHWHGDVETFVQGLVQRGVRSLNNTNTVFQKGTIRINLCGADYIFVNVAGRDRFHISDSRWKQIFAGLDPDNFTCMLSHSPKIAERMGSMPVDLVLSGHTHGGQIRLPFVGSIISLSDPFYKKYDKGLYRFEGGKVLYIDSGAGTSVVPVRFFNQSQITLVTIRGRSRE
jgi:uncharacterized protein